MSTILIVDDEPLIVQLLEEHLQTEGYDTLHAYSGEEALKTLQKNRPDLVILDLMLPGMDGYEVCRLMQQDHRLNHIPVIMLTARSAGPSRVMGYQRGADDYMLKPFDTDELTVRVRAQLHHLYHDNISELTGLPGAQIVEERIQALTKENGTEWVILYVDLEGFTAFNEAYSYMEGDELIKAAGKGLSAAVGRESGDFVGHLGGDKFVVITKHDRVEAIQDTAQEVFIEESRYTYSRKDLAQGNITAPNRDGQMISVPLCRLHFEMVSSEESQA